jgi:hypothetical protein
MLRRAMAAGAVPPPSRCSGSVRTVPTYPRERPPRRPFGRDYNLVGRGIRPPDDPGGARLRSASGPLGYSRGYDFLFREQVKAASVINCPGYFRVVS